jgi:hypothetical protein
MTDIYDIIAANKKFRFEHELEHTDDVDRKRDLEAILENIINIKKPETSVNKFDKVMEYCDNLMMKRKWCHLQAFQKTNRIEHFVELNYKDHEKKQEILAALKSAIDEGHLKLSKDITYDESEATIIKIQGFDFDKLTLKKSTKKAIKTDTKTRKESK